MICTSLIPCLSSGFFVLLSRLFDYFASLDFSQKWGDKRYTKAVKQDIFGQFFKSTTKVTIFFQKPLLVWLKVWTNLTSDAYFQQKLCFEEKSWRFGLFSGDIGDYSDAWMIKITIKTNEIDMNFCFFQKNITYKNHVFPCSPAFSNQFIGL